MKKLLFLIILAVLLSLSILPTQAQTGQNKIHLPLIVKPLNGPTLAGCPMFPADNVWNTPVDTLPVHEKSAQYINYIGATTGFHADFGSGFWPENTDSPIGIPYVIVPGSQPKVTVDLDNPEESDGDQYPIPNNPPIEGGSDPDADRHILMLDKDNCKLYELYAAFPPDTTHPRWTAGSGAVFDLRSNALRPDSWTSADASGLSILAGLVRYDEAMSGEIRHAIRFTVSDTSEAKVWPATHIACNDCPTSAPPMGQRFRLKNSFVIPSTYSPEVQTILRAMKKYGLIITDNGSSWYISGAPDERWNNTHLRELRNVLGSSIEAVNTSSLMISPTSGQAKQP